MATTSWHRSSWARGSMLAAVLLMVAPVVLIPAPAQAAAVAPMTNTFTQAVHGDFIVVGNGVLEGDRRLHRGNSNRHNGQDYMRWVDADADTTTVNSSQATITVPAGASIVHAELGWSANTGTQGSSIITSCGGSALASVPSGSPDQQAVTVAISGGSATFLPTSYADDIGAPELDYAEAEYYAARADVLSLLQNLPTGSPQTITVGNIWSPEGYGCYAGWALELVYDYGAYVPGNSSSTLREVYGFDGFDRKRGFDSADISLSGLQVQGAGAHMGVVGYEGDHAFPGDTVSYEDRDTVQYDLPGPGKNDPGNYFDSYSASAVPFPGLGTPFYNASVTIGNNDLDGLQAGDDSLTVTLGTEGDSYLLQSVTISVPLAEVSIDKTAVNGERDQAIAPGDSPQFRITLYNSGSVPLLGMEVEDPAVPGCSRTPAQLQALINAQYPDGIVPPGGSLQYTCSGVPTTTSFDNTATLKGTTGDGLVVENSGISRVLVSTWTVNKAAKKPDVPRGTSATWVITVTNTGASDIYDVTITDPTVPSCARTVPLITAGSTLTYECSGVVNDTTTNTVNATGTAKADESSTITVPMSGSDDATVLVSGIALEKTASVPVADVGETVTFSFKVTNTGTSTLNSFSINDPTYPSCNQTVATALAPGASTTVTCDVVVFSAASATAVTNTATVTGTPPSGTQVSATDNATVGQKSIKLVKSSATADINGNGVLDAGDTVTYSFTVTNTGSVAVNTLGIVDPMLGTVTCAATTLAPGANTTCTAAAYTVTNADVDAGTLKNTATATATAPDGSTTDSTASVTLTPVQRPSIGLAKAASPTTVDTVGQTVTYTFTVTNTGNTTLTGVTVTDPLAGLSALNCSKGGAAATLPTSLVTGGVMTCTATRAITQTDLNNGSVANTAQATGTSPKGTVVNKSAQATVTATRNPSLSFSKTADATTFGAVGQVIHYTLTTQNTGNVTLSGVAISDPSPRLTNRSCTPLQPATLQPGQSITCTAELTATQADLDGGSILNTGSVTASAPGGTTLTDSKSWTITPATSPGIALTKTPSRTTVTAAGQVITYTLVATNSGNTTLNNVQITDTKAVTFGTCSPAMGSSLAPGAKMTCTATWAVTQAEMDAGQVLNTATTTATDSHGDGVTKDATATVTATANPDIAMSKGVSPSAVSAAGEQVTYTFEFENVGNVTLSNLAIDDPLPGLSAITCAPVGLGGSLAPGDTTTCTATKTITQTEFDAGTLTNNATATLQTPTGADETGTGSATVTMQRSPAFTIAKSASPAQVTSTGDIVTYAIVVTNTGNTTLANLRVTDPRIPSLSCSPTALGSDLAPTEATTCTGTYAATQTDIDAGSITNTATGVLTPPTGTDLTQSDGEVVTTQRNPALKITKTGDATTYDAVGDVINYTIDVENSGNVTLSQVQVTDPLFPASSPLTCSPAGALTLLPGATVQCTGSHTITQADLDASQLRNVATVTGRSPSGTVLTQTDDHVATSVQNPSVSLAKTPTPATITQAGTSVSYSIVLTNTGNVTLTDAQISDPMFASFSSCTPALGSALVPGGTMTCTASRAATQADVDAGSITNTATGAGTAPSGVRPSTTATAVVAVTADPKLTLAKTSNPTRVSAVGQVVTYTFTVRNTGNVTATGITVTDPIDGLSAITCNATTLAPGASTTCTATRSTTQADLNEADGIVTNTATVNATTTKGAAFPPATASNDLDVTQTPKLDITKSADLATVSAVGETITYSIDVTNTGNVTLADVQVTDAKVTGLSCTPAVGSTLAPGGTMYCTGTRAVTQVDLDAGSLQNTASVTGVGPNGVRTPAVSADATVGVTVNDSLTFAKDVSPTTVTAAGQTVNYTFAAQNTGNVSLGGVLISDPKTDQGMTDLQCQVYESDGTTVAGPGDGAVLLKPGQWKKCTASLTATLADMNAGSITNTASVSSALPDGTARMDLSDGAVVTATQSPAITLAKDSDTQTYSVVGQSVGYTFTVRNAGNVSLTNVQLDDPLPDLYDLSCTPALGSTLAPNATMSCTASYDIKQSDIDNLTLTNNATATGTAPDNSTVNASKSKTITAVLNPALTVTKAGSPTTVSAAGDTVTYTITVKNTGNVTLNPVEVSDPMLPSLNCGATTLAPGGTTTCTGAHTVTQANVDAGKITNTATASGTDPAGTTVTRTTSATVNVTQTPELGLTKSADLASFNAVGQTITYTFTVTNTGNTTINDIAVDDPLNGMSAITCTATTLAPTASTTCTGTYTTRQTDLDRGRIDNTATVSGTTTTGVTVPDATASESVPAVQNLTWTFDKSVSPTTYNKAAQTLTYSFVVANTGNVTIQGVYVTDPLTSQGLSALSCTVHLADGSTKPGAGQVALPPGAEKRCTATYAVKQADVDAGSVVNTATAAGSHPDGTALTPLTDSATATATQNANMTLVKTANVASYSSVGQVVTYTLTATNTGNVTMTNTQVADPQLGALSCTPALGSAVTPGASMVCTGTHTVSLADMNNQKIDNEATANASTAAGDLVRKATKSIPAEMNPSIVGKKSASVETVNAAGTVITYSIEVVNDGNVTVTISSISDPLPDIGTFSCPTNTIDPGTSVTCTASYTVKQADIDRGSLNNTATVKAVDSANTEVDSVTSALVRVEQTPALSITKTADVASVDAVGDPIVYSFLVKNTGNTTVNSIAVTDPLFTPSAITCPQTSLAPGAEMTCTRTWNTTQTNLDAGQVTNTAAVTGQTATGATVPRVTSSVTVPAVQNVDWQLTKTADNDQVTSIGQTVTYTIAVTNTGNVSLKDVVLKDPKLGSPLLSGCELVEGGAVVAPVSGPALVKPGQTLRCFGTQTFNQPDFEVPDPDTASPGIDWDNTATADGKGPDGTVLTQLSADETVYLFPSPDFAMTKTADVQDYSFVGQEITYTVQAENSGNVELTNVTIVDQLLENVTLTCSPVSGSTLQPGERMICQGTYQVTQDDVNAGSINNEAYGKGTDNQGVIHDATAPGQLTVTYVGETGMSLSKSASPGVVSAVGETVTFTFTVANLGAADLENVTITDTMAGMSAVSCPSTTVLVGEVMRCTATYTVDQDDINAGSFQNNASATATSGGQDLSDTAHTTVLVNQNPSIAVTKSVAVTDGGATVDSTSDTLNYSFLMENTGNVPLNTVGVTDPMATMGTVSCPQTTLDPGETMTCTATATVTQGMLDAPTIKNTATATGTPTFGNTTPVTGTGTATIGTTWNPAMTIDKTASSTTVSKAGDVVTFTMTATNTGNVTLSSVEIDDSLAGLPEPTCTPVRGSSLAPNATMVCTADYTVTQADVDAGSILNTATLGAATPDGTSLAPVTDDATVTAPANPQLTVEKTAANPTFDYLNEPLNYTITVANTGNVTLSVMRLTDNLTVENVACTPALGGSLAPGQNMICQVTHRVTQADLDGNGVQNFATATGDDPAGNPVSDTNDAPAVSTPIKKPVLDFTKTASPTTVSAAGTVVTYTFTATNKGNTTWLNPSIADPLDGLSPLTCDPLTEPGKLAPAESLACTATYTVTQADIDAAKPELDEPFSNTATVTATDTDGAQTTETATANITLQHNPAVTVTKSANPATVTVAGQTVTYTFTVENTGNVKLVDLEVTDPLLGGSVCTIAELAQGATTTCTGTLTVDQGMIDKGSIPNTATVKGFVPTRSNSVENTGSTTVNATRSPAMTLSKTASPTTVSAVGQTVTYTFAIENTGNVTLTDVGVTDPLNGLSTINCGQLSGAGELAPGQTETCTATYQVTQDDLDAGSITNTATLKANTLQGAVPPVTAGATVTADQQPGIEVTKAVDLATYDLVGEVLTYTIVIKNTGNVSLQDLDLTDSLPVQNLNCVPALTTALGAGNSITCTATYTITQADLDNLKVTNIASAHGHYGVDGTEVSDTSDPVVSDAIVTSSIDLIKKASKTTVSQVGELVTFTFTATNTGRSTLSGVTITDPLDGLTAMNCAQPATLAPNEKLTCTASYTVTQDDLNNARPDDGIGIVNTATVTSTDPTGATIDDSDRVDIVVQSLPAMTVDKSVAPLTYAAVGDTLTYTFLITNTGNVDLHDITLSDPMFAAADITCTPALAGLTVAPQGTVSCEATRTVTQQNLDEASIRNTATVNAVGADNVRTATDTDSARADVDAQPAIALAKSVSPAAVNAVGDTTTYTFTATNTGNQTLTGVKITDPIDGLTALTCTITDTGGGTRPGEGLIILAPGEYKTCTATRAVTQADMDAGTVLNTATVVATAPAGALPAVTADAVVTVNQDPRIEVVKSTSSARPAAEGDQIVYDLKITNTGSVTLTDISVDDTMPGLGPLDCGGTSLASLAPGDNIYCSVTKTVTATEMNQPTLVNNVRVNATNPNGTNPPEATDSVTVIPVHYPGLALDKTHAIASATGATKAAIDAVGDVVTYSFLVTNTGNIEVSGIVVTDALDGLSAVTCPVTTLAVGASTTCTATYAVTQDDLNRGSIQNSASVDGEDPLGGDDVTKGADTDVVPANRNPEMSLTKTPVDPTTPRALGDIVTFTIELTNTGNVTLTQATVTDTNPDLTSLGCSPTAPATLAPTEKMTCTATVRTTQAAIDRGAVINSANATANDPTGSPVTVPQADAQVPTVEGTGTVDLTKVADRAEVTAAGQIITYTFTATNSGDYTLNDVAITDPLNGLSALSCDRDAPVTLAPSEKLVCTATYAVTQADVDAGQVDNTATVNSTEARGNTAVSNTADESVPATQNPALDFAKTSNVTEVSGAGDTILYTLSVRNAGNVTVNTLTITDSLTGLGPIACVDEGGTAVALPADLAPTKRLTCQASYTVTQADMDSGSILNSAKADGITELGVPVASPSQGITVLASQRPGIELKKDADVTLVQRIGQTITYTLTAKNTGNVTLDSAAFTDDMTDLSALSCTPAAGSSLAPGAIMTCTATYVTKHSDLEAGGINNTARFTSTDQETNPVNGEVSHNVPVLYNPELQFDKSVQAPTNWRAGDEFTYVFRVENTGNMDAWYPQGVDTMLETSSLECHVGTIDGRAPDPGLPLPPGGVVYCLASYTATQADADRGYVVNTAQLYAWESEGIGADGRPTGYPYPVLQDQARTDTTLQGSITATKTADVASFNQVGQTINYSFRIENTGPLTVTVDPPIDDLPGISEISCPTLTLAPGDVTVCTATYAIRQVDMDNGSLTNDINVTGRDTHGNTVGPVPASTTIVAVRNPELSIDKSANTSQVSAAGEVVEFVVTVDNTGDVTASNVTIVEDLAGATIVSCDRAAPVTLAPQEELSCTVRYTVVQDDINRGYVRNTARVQGTTPQDVAIPEDTVTIDVPASRNPVVSLTKTPDKTTVDTLGETITYTMVARNEGNVTLFGTTIADPLPGLSALTCTPAAPADLDPGATLTCTATYNVTQANLDGGSIANRATVRGDTLDGNRTDPADDITAVADATVTADPQPELSLAKSSDVSTVSALSDVITYSFLVKNVGNVTLTDVNVEDPYTAQGMSDISCPKTGLAPQEEMTCTATFSPQQTQLDKASFTNTATATGRDLRNNIAVPGTGSATVNVDQQPSLSVNKTADHTRVTFVGEKVLYTIRGTNTGNVTASVVEIIDPLPGLKHPGTNTDGLECYPNLPAELPPGDSVVCRTELTVTQEILNSRELTNTSTITGRGPLDQVIDPDTDTETIETVITGSLEVVKTADTAIVEKAGDVVTYTLLARNTANVPITNVTLSDEIPEWDLASGAVTCSQPLPTTLNPLQGVTCTVAHVVTQEEIDSGKIHGGADPAGAPADVVSIGNRASGSADNPDPAGIEPWTDTSDKWVQVVPVPNISIVKTASPERISTAGETVTFTFRVENTGTVLLNNVAITDKMPEIPQEAIDCTGADGIPADGSGFSLAAGEVRTCTATYVATQDDLNTGSISNVATVVGEPPAAHNLPPVSAEAIRVVPAEQNPDFAFEMSADKQTYSTVGEVITYTMQITNTGNITGLPTLSPKLAGLSGLSCAKVPAPVSGGGIGVGAVGGTPAAESQPMELAPGEVCLCTATYVVTQADIDAGSIVNPADSTFDPERGGDLSDSDSIIVTAVQNFTASVKKTPRIIDTDNDGLADVGEVVEYTIVARNTGNTSLRNARILDAKVSGLRCTPTLPATIPPGEQVTCVGRREVTEADGESGTINNTATLVAGNTTETLASSAIVKSESAPAPSIIGVRPRTGARTLPDISAGGLVVKKEAWLTEYDGDRYSEEGETLTYVIWVSNTGITPLTGVYVRDPMLPRMTCSKPLPARLAPGESMQCGGRHVVTRTEGDAGSLQNVASATADGLGIAQGVLRVLTGPQTLANTGNPLPLGVVAWLLWVPAGMMVVVSGYRRRGEHE